MQANLSYGLDRSSCKNKRMLSLFVWFALRMSILSLYSLFTMKSLVCLCQNAVTTCQFKWIRFIVIPKNWCFSVAIETIAIYKRKYEINVLSRWNVMNWIQRFFFFFFTVFNFILWVRETFCIIHLNFFLILGRKTFHVGNYLTTDIYRFARWQC